MRISQAKKQETIALILHHAYGAFLEQDYDLVKLSDISKASGIAEGTLYNYFKDKPTLFISVFMRYRGGSNEVLQVKRPASFQDFIEELMAIFPYYMKIDHPVLAKSFKRYIHLTRGQQLSGDDHMEAALQKADDYLYGAIKDLLALTPLQGIEENDLFSLLIMQAEGLYNEYLYKHMSFSSFLRTLRIHYQLMLKPFIGLD